MARKTFVGPVVGAVYASYPCVVSLAKGLEDRPNRYVVEIETIAIPRFECVEPKRASQFRY